MNKSIIACAVLGTVCSVAVLATTAGPTIAATKKAKEPAPAVAGPKPAKQHSVQEQNSPLQQANKSPIPTARERQPEAIQKQGKSALAELKSINPVSPKSHRRTKVHRKRTPNAVVQPRTDLMYHGMLESSQRYNPRRNHLGAGVPDPHNPELIHDHFQELDRNQDGAIDPVERTFGRPDMDRDLYDRRPR